MIPWIELRSTVEIMQRIIASSMKASSEGDGEASALVNMTYDMTAQRVEALAAKGIDLLDEQQLFTYVSGYTQAVMVAHKVMHAYDFQSEEVEPDDQCASFIYGTVANLLPLMQLLPLHLIVEMAE
jgi:hypothetical protein